MRSKTTSVGLGKQFQRRVYELLFYFYETRAYLVLEVKIVLFLRHGIK